MSSIENSIMTIAFGKIKTLEDENAELLEQIKEFQDIVKAVAHIGVDFGYGEYQVEDKYIEQAREYFNGLDNKSD